MENIQQLQELAEKERCSGNRQKFLEIQKQIEVAKQEEVLKAHNEYYERVKNEFKIGSYIPEIHASIKEIKHDCGTQRGWIDIYLSSDKHYTPHELRKKIRLAKEMDEATTYFNNLKFSDRAKSLCIGLKDNETLEKLIKVMSLDLPTIEEIEENNFEYLCDVMNQAKNRAIEDGYTDDEAQEMAEKEEGDELDNIYKEHLSRILATLNYLLNFHDIELSGIGKNYCLITKTSWKEVANKVAETITGYGLFEYKNGKDLRDCLPSKTYCKAVISHLHWLKHYPEVYGANGYRRIYEK